MKSMFAAVVVFAGLTGPGAAQAPVAVVEEVQGTVTGVEFMDYVAPGKVIKLGPNGSVVLGYMKSCWRETIAGVGTVIVGAEESMVHLGQVKANKVACDSSNSRLVDRQVGESAATVVRSMDGKASMSPQFTLYGLSPVVETTGRGRLVVRGKFYDFAKTHTTLRPGGVYTASLGSKRAIFLVDRQAEPGSSPIIGRLVRME